MSDLVEELRSGWSNDVHARPFSVIMGEAADELTSLRARVLVLEGALRPFAEICDGRKDGIWSEDPDHWSAAHHEWGKRVTVGMVRQAATALQGLSQDQGREGYGSSRAESGGTASPKSDGMVSTGKDA